MLFGHPRAELSAYLDARLHEPARARLERHLARCVACRRELETLRQTVALVRRLPSAEPPRSFVLRAVPVGARVPRQRPVWTALAAGLAAMLVLAAASGLLWPLAFTPGGSAPAPLAPAREAAPAKPAPAPALRAGPAVPPAPAPGAPAAPARPALAEQARAAESGAAAGAGAPAEQVPAALPSGAAPSLAAPVGPPTVVAAPAPAAAEPGQAAAPLARALAPAAPGPPAGPAEPAAAPVGVPWGALAVVLTLAALLVLAMARWRR